MNYYSYSPAEGMQYHTTGSQAKDAAEAAIRRGISEKPGLITWGEVTERATDTGAGYTLRRQERLTYEIEYPQVIDGRMEDADGSLVLVSRIRETDLLYNDLVLSIAVIWRVLSGKIQRFKQYTFEDVSTVLALLLEKHGV